MRPILSIVGLSGAGKSTVARGVAEQLGVKPLSTGEALREVAVTQPELASALAAGLLGPEDLVKQLVDAYLANGDTAVLDGYPRHRAQAESLLGRSRPLLIVHLAIDPEVALARIRQRPMRGDDTEASIQTRITRDAEALSEVLEILENAVFNCDATTPIARIASTVVARYRQLSLET